MCADTKYSDKTKRPPIAIIGTGPVGRTLGKALFDAGYPISCVVGLHRAEVQSLGKQLQAYRVGSAVQAIPQHTKIFLLAVSDDQIAPVAHDLSKLEFLSRDCIAIHCSGALSVEIMAPLRSRQVRLLSFHPMASFARKSRRRLPKGIYIGIDGDKDAIPTGFQLARDIGAVPIEIPRELKTAYHLAGVWASNFLVGLLAQASTLLEEVGYDKAKSWDILEPLIKGTINQVGRSGVEQALTGPALRGDILTIKHHLDWLADNHPELLAVYREMTKTLITTLVKNPGNKHREILNILDKF